MRRIGIFLALILLIAGAIWLWPLSQSSDSLGGVDVVQEPRTGRPALHVGTRLSDKDVVSPTEARVTLKIRIEGVVPTNDTPVSLRCSLPSRVKRVRGRGRSRPWRLVEERRAHTHRETTKAKSATLQWDITKCVMPAWEAAKVKPELLSASADPWEWPEELEIIATHPECAKTSVRLAFPTPSEAPQVISVSLVLVRLRTIELIVRDVNGAPMVGGLVAVHYADRTVHCMSIDESQGLACKQVLPEVPSARVKLNVPTKGAYVVTAKSFGRLAQMRVIDIIEQGTQMDEIVLSPPCSISGRITVLGAPVKRAWVAVNSLRTGDDLAVAGERVLIKRNGGLVPARGWVTSQDDDGQFVVHDLEPFDVSVMASFLRDPAVHPDLLGEAHKFVVTPPAHDVDIDIKGAILDIRVTDANGLRKGANVIVHSHEEPPPNVCIVTTDESGEASIVVRPNTSYSVRAQAIDGVELEGARIVAGAEGERRAVELSTARTSGEFGTIILSLRLASGETAAPIGVCLVALGEHDDEDEIVHGQTGAKRTEWDHIPVGRWIVCTVGTSHHILNAVEKRDACFYTPFRNVVNVRSGVVHKVDLLIKIGGHLRVSALGNDNQFVAAKIELVSAAGVVSEPMLGHRHGEDSHNAMNRIFAKVNTVTVSSHLGTGGGGHQSTTIEALAPGDYTIVMSASGYETVRDKVTIKPGEVSEFHATMKRMKSTR